MKKTYFIDSENVGDNWISLLNTVAPDDELIVFYTLKSPHMNYKNVILLKQSEKEITFIECCDGNNAQPVESVVSSCVTASSFDCIEIVEKETISSSNGVDANAKELLFIIGKNNLSMLHEALTQLYGNKKCKSIYNAFKSDTAYNNFLTKHEKMTLSEKYYHYCSIVFSMMAPNEKMPEDFPVFLVNSWKQKKNLNSLRSLLQQHYRKDKSDKYYSLFKVHIKILDKIT